MNSVLLDNNLFYNGAETYKDSKWVLFTNISKFYAKHSETCILHSGLICKFSKEAYDKIGNKLTDTIAIMVPEQLNQKASFDKYTSLTINLGRLYGERLVKAGLVEEGFFGWRHLPYIGCEEEYGIPKLSIKEE